ncbi:hypothetical protein C9426_30215 [Serratia sp. S1B]|nr:hypothetical protein C9426_30215 [Serratia sp. S1B]
MKNFKFRCVVIILITNFLSGCSILSDYYYEDCTIHPDNFKYLKAEEQNEYLKKCKSVPDFKKVEPI